MNKLGKFTKAGSSLLIMAMAGPVIILPLLGMIEDMQKAYGICIPCFLFILYYGAIGHKAGMKNVK